MTDPNTVVLPNVTIGIERGGTLQVKKRWDSGFQASLNDHHAIGSTAMEAVLHLDEYIGRL